VSLLERVHKTLLTECVVGGDDRHGLGRGGLGIMLEGGRCNGSGKAYHKRSQATKDW
jgi:hypothetical protein